MNTKLSYKQFLSMFFKSVELDRGMKATLKKRTNQIFVDVECLITNIVKFCRIIVNNFNTHTHT